MSISDLLDLLSLLLFLILALPWVIFLLLCFFLMLNGTLIFGSFTSFDVWNGYCLLIMNRKVYIVTVFLFSVNLLVDCTFIVLIIVIITFIIIIIVIITNALV